MERQYYVYLLTNYTNTVIYTGMTNNLIRRVQEHRDKTNKGFTSRYNVWKLVYFEEAAYPGNAIEREKQIKAGPRRRKVELIEAGNPPWRDLWHEIIGSVEPAELKHPKHELAQLYA